MRFICSFILNGKHLAPKEVRDIGSNPIRSTICPGDGIGIRTWLKPKVLRVRLPPGTPFVATNGMRPVPR